MEIFLNMVNSSKHVIVGRFGNGILGRFMAYVGPAILVSLAYMDPGNFGTAIEGGANFNYDLVWIVWLSSLMAMLLQYISGKIGIATNRSLAEIIRAKLKKKFIIPYWIGAEAIIAATDLAEYLGTVIALNLLFGIPLLHAAVIGAVDVLLILTLTSRRFRLLEQIFMIFVSIIGIGYLYEIIVVEPDIEQVVYHSFVPALNDRSALVAVGVIGATVMPHALYIHSWLTKRRLPSKHSIRDKRELLKLHRSENIIMLTIAGLINASIMIMSAAAFYGSYQVVTIEDAYMTLIPLFGSLAGLVFAITLLVSGISSSTLGTIAGQAVFEDLLSRKGSKWLRRIITRFVNVIPTTIALLIGLEPLDILVYSQVVLSLLIPLPLIPLILISKDKSIMGEFVNKRITTILAIVFAAIIIAFNVYLLYSL